MTTQPTLVLPSKGSTGLLIDGQWIDPKDGGTLDVHNPSNRSIITTIGRSTAADVDQAVASSQKAFRTWRQLPARERGAFLTRLGNAVADNAEDIARLLAAETGNAIRTQSRGEVASTAEVLRYYGGTASEQKGETLPLGQGLFSYSTRDPLGVVAAIIPWNSPLVLGAVKIGMALATGNTLILKPAEDAPLAVIRVCELAAEILPTGVLNVVTGRGSEAGAALSQHPDVAKVSFTGSSEVGRGVLHAVADRIGHATLELGGKSPAIVFPDSNTDETAKNVVAAMRFARQGQSCTAGSRLFVHADIWDDFMPKVVAAVNELVIGDALDEATDMGAVINPTRYQEISEFVQEAADQGAQFLAGGPSEALDADTPLRLTPAVIAGVDNNWRISREEVFGPVLVAIPWKTEDDVVAWANDTHYGLAAYVFTQDLNTALRMAENIDAGWVQINRAGGQLPGMSYGGRKQSGIGAEYSIEGALESYTQRKSITIAL
ncbi:aldehyde dehydrogenase family protein [Pseudarthrobacter sp. efr-133-R2A-89]|jgi:acyl-CoA reductase-like NAD-dependent aldehyde dehydrogenase|uniref:aldehyde dehydrogenase family protein n=1 Tax=Pseudarthrobacter sp. efr-133-R2A-89 TaxID=3040302 RepID=UPI001064B911|nr:aldehyde dehydrogenase family protein [Pseudarthrobacter sp. efr-133-R2A-89]